MDVIGDCVIVAGNLHKDQADHMHRLCQFTLGALQAAAETPIAPGTDFGPVQIRCG